jgi:hypothetical protein
LKPSKTTAKLPSARCSSATVPLASDATRWNEPIATVVGPEAAALEAGLETALGATVVAPLGCVDAGAGATELTVPPEHAAIMAVVRTTSSGPAARFIGGLDSVDGHKCRSRP